MTTKTIALIGNIGGDDYALVTTMSARMNDHPPSRITNGRRHVTLDGRLDGSLSRLLPVSYGNATATQWAPFIHRAIALGML